MSSRQMVLDVSLPEGATFDGFYVGTNQQLMVSLQQMISGQGDWLLYLHGIAGSGRSHLLQASCRAVVEQGQSAAYVPLNEFVAYPVEALDGLETMSLLALDDMQAIAGNVDWEQRMFRLFNAVSDHGGRLLVSASDRAEQLGMQLPDLVSRLNWGLTQRLEALDDLELEPAFQLRARQRGMSLGEGVVRYLLSRNARDWDSLSRILDELDKVSLEQKRRLSLPFVKSVLEQMADQDASELSC